MGPKIVINNKEVTNPVTKILISLSAFSFSILFAIVVVFLILPFVGVVVTATVGVVITVLVSLVIGVPLLMLVGAIIGIFLKPFGGKKKDKEI